MSMQLDSILIHGGIDGDPATGAVNIPIYQTSTYRQTALGENTGWEYSRTGNPTRAALEKLLADLESGSHGLAFASGMAAVTAVLSLFRQGDKLLLSSNVYGGTFRVLDKVFQNFGITYEIIDTTALSTLPEKLTTDVKAVYVESPANPLLTVTDIVAVSEIAHRYGKLMIVDNTFMTPYLQRPLSLGADIVIHSGTKYLGGHSDVISGFVVVKDQALANRLYFLQNSTGGVLGPFDSFLMLRGIKTLGVRMDRHTANAEAIAGWLEVHPAVKHVYYPGLERDPGYTIQKKQASRAGGMISFELHPNYDSRIFFRSLHLVTLAESLGGVESLVCHPATMTHAAIQKEIREKAGITESLIRLSVGIEDRQDIQDDLEQAIQAAKKG